MAITNKDTRIVTGEVRASYAYVFEPRKEEDGADEKYSMMILIPKSDKATLAKIEKAIAAAKEIGKSSKFGGKIPAKLNEPLRDGDEERPDEEVYEGMYFMNLSSKQKPGIVDKFKNIIDSADDFYSGCYAKVSINFFPYNTNGNKGIAAGLNNILKTRDGDYLGGRSSAFDDFADEFDADADDLF